MEENQVFVLFVFVDGDLQISGVYEDEDDAYSAELELSERYEDVKSVQTTFHRQEQNDK